MATQVHCCVPCQPSLYAVETLGVDPRNTSVCDKKADEASGIEAISEGCCASPLVGKSSLMFRQCHTVVCWHTGKPVEGSVVQNDRDRLWRIHPK
eukprot:3034024-Prymnesium_polylepis.2